MEWYYFALLAALFTSFGSITTKKILIKERSFEFSVMMAIVNFILVVPLLFMIDYNFPPKVWLYIFGAGFFGSLAFLAVAKGIKHLDISISSPLLCFGPVITALIAYAFLGERITSIQLLGIFIIILGSYILELDPKSHNLKEPLKRIISSRYAQFIFLALLLYGFSSIFDKKALGSISALTYIPIVHFFIVLNFLLMIFLFHKGIRTVIGGFKLAGPWVIVLGIFIFTYRYFQAEAMSLAMVSLVVPIKRSSALITTIVGGKIYKEKNILLKTSSCLIMILGIVLIVI